MNYKLQRLSQSDEGVFGALTDDKGNHICYTAELPWNDNHPDTSCIPEGSYDITYHNSKEHPDTFEIMNVPNRVGILIHEGNLPLKDSLGCIIVGMKIGFLETKQAVLESVVALNLLRNKLQIPSTIDIINPIQP